MGAGTRTNFSRALFVLFIIFGLVSCIDEDEYINTGSSRALAVATSRVYNKILDLAKVFNHDMSSGLRHCIKDVEDDFNGAFKFANDLDFLSSCIKEMKDVSMRVCTAAEMKLYFYSFMDTKSADSAHLRPNQNCNSTLWWSGCEAGWSCALPENAQVDLTNINDIPERTRDSQPCCAGFFCPRGLTCMIPCPLGSYCPRATLNKATGTCEPYAYQPPSGKANHSCGGADTWEGVTNSEEIFCSAGSYCPTTTKKIPCTEGFYCRQGSTKQKACFGLSTCNPNSEQQNLHKYGFMLIGALSLIMIVFYNFSDRIITIRYARLAKSRERAARSARETAQARERWKLAKNRAVSWQQQQSRTLSRKRSAQQGGHLNNLNQATTSNSSLPPTIPSNSSRPPSGVSKQKKEGNLTKMLQSLEDDPDSHKGFDVEIGDKNIKKQMPKPQAKELHTKSQIFKYAYGQLEKEKAKEQKRQNLTFSGVIAMATDKDTKTRPSIEVAFKDLTITLKNKHKHLMRSVTGKILPGRLSAVMGPSGAGKTTFLSAVAGKIRGCTISGSILVNGRHDSIHCYKKIIGFVPQDDIVHGDLTVEENLRFSARCRLSVDMPKADKVLIVERVIESLGLQGVRDSLVGTVEKRGISGGQRKRVNVGLEMVMEPSLLILDEPTSGLDSSSSNLLIKALKREALEGVNICMVVHQPSYSLYKMFDDLILLAKGGLTVYHGPVKKVEDYFRSFGITIPDRVTPSDHLIDILEGIVKLSPGLTVEQLPVRWMLHNGYPVPPDMLQYCDPITKSSEGANPSAHAVPKDYVPGGARKDNDEHSHRISLITNDLSNRCTASMMRQGRYFLGRTAKQRLREAKMTAADYLILLLAGVCLGTLSKRQGDTFGYYGYMYTVIAISLLCKISALRSFSQDKLQHRRESESGMSSFAYFSSKDTIDLLNVFIKPLVFLSMFYSFYHPRSSFLDNYVVLVGLIYCVTGISYIFAILLQPGPAQLLCVIFPVVLTLVASQGKDDIVGKYVAPYCYPQWALKAFIISNAERYSGVWLITRCAALFDLGYDVHHRTLCIILLLVSGVICRIIAFLCLKFGRQ